MSYKKPEWVKISDSLTYLSDTYEDNFQCGFENLLWETMIEKSCEGAFMSTEDGEVGVAISEGGYIPTGCFFDIEVDHWSRRTILAKLNLSVFGLRSEDAHQLVKDSLRKQILEGSETASLVSE